MVILKDRDRIISAAKAIENMRRAGTLKNQKTTQQIFRRIRSFEGYASDFPRMALNLLRLLSDINLGNRQIPQKFVTDREVVGGKMGIFVPNAGQILIWDGMMEQAMAGLPVRIIGPKARRQGFSTAIDVTFDFLCFHLEDRKAMIVAHQDESAKIIFETVLQSHAKYLEKFGKKRVNWQGLAKTKIEYEKTGSTFRVGTAMGRFKGSGGTLNYLHISELAKYDQTSGQDSKAMRSLLNSVTKNDPDTIIAIESSGQGPSGEFYRRVKAAFGSSDNDGKEDYSDETTTQFKGVFLPWTIDKMCVSVSKNIPKTFDEFRPKPDGYELRLISEFKVTPAQLMWRREELKDEGITDYSSNPPEWAWEWPVEWEDCFRGQSGLVYGMMTKKPPRCQVISDEYFSPESYDAHAIDWGQSESSPFCCLWIKVDPTKSPALVVSPDCVRTWDEFASYMYDPKTNQPRKEKDHAMDAIRYFVSTNKIRGLAYVYRELFIKDFGEKSGVGEIAKKIHEAQGWVHKHGNPDSMNFYEYVPGPGAVKEFHNGVMDRAAGLAIIGEFCKWGIKVRGYEPPAKGDSGRNAVSAGIAMVGALCSGNLILEEPDVDRDAILAASAARKLRSSREWPTDEEFAAYERKMADALGESAPSQSRRFNSTGWAEITG